MLDQGWLHLSASHAPSSDGWLVDGIRHQGVKLVQHTVTRLHSSGHWALQLANGDVSAKANHCVSSAKTRDRHRIMLAVQCSTTPLSGAEEIPTVPAMAGSHRQPCQSDPLAQCIHENALAVSTDS